MSQTRKINGWIAHVDEWAGFATDTAVVRIFYKPKEAAFIGLHAPDGNVEHVKREMGAALPQKEGFEFHIPIDAIPALCAALQEQDPATERLTTKLEQLLEREAGRVDRLIEKTSSPVVLSAAIGTVGDDRGNPLAARQDSACGRRVTTPRIRHRTRRRRYEANRR